MTISYKVSIYPAALDGLSRRGAMIDRAVETAAGVVRDTGRATIYAAGRVDTGAMAQQTVAEPLTTGPRKGAWWLVISKVPYSLAQHQGTRDHGPRRAKVLRFRPKGQQAYVFAHRVRGVKPLPFLTDALHRLTARDFRPY